VGRFVSLPRVSNDASGRSLGPRATCGVIAVVVSADLLAFRLDPQTARRDTTRAESRDRARARLAKASRAEISEWEVNGRFHGSPFNGSSISSRSAGSAFARDRLRCPARPRNGSAGHIHKRKSRPWWVIPKKRKSRRDALTRRAVYGRGDTSAPRAACQRTSGRDSQGGDSSIDHFGCQVDFSTECIPLPGR